MHTYLHNIYNHYNQLDNMSLIIAATNSFPMGAFPQKLQSVQDIHAQPVHKIKCDAIKATDNM